jgi:hypothetical protein
LYFSSSDNTDPRSNGRAYTLLAPKTLASSFRHLAWLAAKPPRYVARRARFGKLLSLFSKAGARPAANTNAGTSKAA